MFNEERANYWIDQYYFYLRTGRFRGGLDGSGPFIRASNPFDNPNNHGNSESSEITSNLFTYFIIEIFTPVDHSIPLSTLINVHFIMTLGLFKMVAGLLLLTIYFYINLLILFNKDYLLNKVKNKYVLIYVKYVVFRTRVDIFIIGIINLSVLVYIIYILHYLIVHPIVLG